jgi:hypothetical protein
MTVLMCSCMCCCIAAALHLSSCSHLNRKYMNAIVEQPLYLANNAPRARVPSSIYVPPPLQVRRGHPGVGEGLGWPGGGGEMDPKQ